MTTRTPTNSAGFLKDVKLGRTTRETTISLTLNLRERGIVEIATGIGFLDHMLTALATHAGWSLTLKCTGDMHVDDHHTAEDCAIALGEAIDEALGSRTDIARFGSAYAPLDEALARAVVDLVRRPSASVDLMLVRDKIGEIACENITHVFVSLAMAGRFTLHVDVIKGMNDHHKAEAAFKALALAFKQALVPVAGGGALSTKGVM